MTDSKPYQNFLLMNVFVISMQYMIIEIYTIVWCPGRRMPDNVCATFVHWAFNFDG